MGTPELTPDIVTTAAIWAGVTVAVLLTAWLVVRSAVRSEFRAERRRTAVQDSALHGSALHDSAGRATMRQADDVARGGVAVVAAAPAAPPTPAPTLAPTLPPANPYASPPPPFPTSLAHLPPPRSDSAIFESTSSPGIMSGSGSEAHVAAVDAGAGVSVVDAAPSLTAPPPVAGGSIAMQPAAARHALEQLVAHAPESPDPAHPTNPELRPRPYGRHS